MRTGVPLSVLRNEVLIEAGYSTDAGHSVFSKEKIDQLIARTERQMGRMDTWPGVHFEEQVAVAANARYVNLPDDITYADTRALHVMFGSDWLPVTYGISANERSIYSSTERATPIMRWEVVAPGDEKFEVWPIGASAQTLLFSGQKTLGTFSDDTDTCTLDADVLVLKVAARILGRDRKEDAALMLREAQEMQNDLLKDMNVTRRQINMGGGHRGTNLRPGIDYIPPGSGM